MFTNQHVKIKVMNTFEAPTFGQFESQYRRDGKDASFNTHLAVRRLEIEVAKLLVPIVDQLARVLNKVFPPHG